MVLELAQLYRYVEIEHSELFDPDVVTPYGSEPKWRKDVLWALQDAKRTRNPQTDRQWQVAENLSSHFGLPTLFPPFWKVLVINRTSAEKTAARRPRKDSHPSYISSLSTPHNSILSCTESYCGRVSLLVRRAPQSFICAPGLQ